MQEQFPPMPGIVLAGGRSLRMGWPKALLRWPGETVSLGRHVTSTLRDAGLSPLAIVTGAHHDQIAPLFADTDVAVVYNADHDAGQLSSLQLGLRWGLAVPGAEWVLVTLVDVPAVQADTVRHLIAQARHSSALVVRPVIGASHGHPVIWRREAVHQLDQADPAVGGRSVVRALAARGRVLDVPVDDAGVLLDVDTPDEYDALRRAMTGPASES